MSAESILKKVFGYPEFRGTQREIVDHLLQNQHALVIMPTGMGKSLCYQIPALELAARCRAKPPMDSQPSLRPPLTLVLSPLIALMKDQVDALQSKGVQATFINSSLEYQERAARYQAIHDGRFDLLYVTPERFRKPDFLEVLKNRLVPLLAVDEAHCISQWGHDFRPDYTRLREIRQILGYPTTIALTATATPEVQQDIVRQLGLTPDEVKLFHEGIERPNLQLQVLRCWGIDEKLKNIVETNQQTPGAGIVYFTLIRTLMEYSQLLQEQSIPHLVYHGDVPRRQRRSVQEWFMSDEHLVLATNAFGMGIDRDSIRFVMHAELPSSVESYYQEIGRAGRDGLAARCTLLYDEHDLNTQMEFIRWSNPNAEFYRRVYDLLVNDHEKVAAFGIAWLKEKLHFKQSHDHRVETVIGMLDRYGCTSGSLEKRTLRVVGDLPTQLADQEWLSQKLMRDQQRLYGLVQYVNHQGSSKEFFGKYFGIPSED